MATPDDNDPLETREWLDALRAVAQHRGTGRAKYLLERLRDEAAAIGSPPAPTLNTRYANTIPPEQEEKSPGDRELEHKIRSAIRWNAVAILLRANKESS